MVQKIVTILLLAALALTYATSEAARFDLSKGEDQYFLVDHAVFNSSEPDKVRLEVYYQIYNAALEFTLQQGAYVADYEVSVNVYGDKDVLEDSFSQNRSLRVLSDEKAKSKYDYRTSQVDFDLVPGKYEIKVTLTGPSLTNVLERRFKVKLKRQLEKSPRLSDIQLIQAAGPVGDEPTKFDRGGFTLVPSVSHKYGTTDALKLMFYFEIYQGKEVSDSVTVETKLRHDTKGMLYRDSLTLGFDGGLIRQFREISMENLRPGQFRLDVTLLGRRDHRFDQQTKYFELVWSEQSLLQYDYQAIVGQLSLISLPGEIQQLKKHETFDERLNAFNAFWDARDPTPGTAENETKNEFYRRVRVANQNFSYLRTAGWRTDRGRVYIVYGEPDQVEDYPFDINRLPYQEWHYYRDARYRKFVFIDETGDGDFRLIYPYDGLIGPEY